jgi:hypothetical protein
MAVQTERFKITQTEVRAVSRYDTSYRDENKGREIHNYFLEIWLYDQDSMMIDYDEDKAARDADYEVVAAVIA